MRYYITDSEGAVVAKIDGRVIDILNGHEMHEVSSVEELSNINVEDWHQEYQS